MFDEGNVVDVVYRDLQDAFGKVLHNRLVGKIEASNYKHMVAASLNDSGTYLCEANAFYHGVKKKSDEVSVSVKEVFSKPVLSAESEVKLFEGQQLKLLCLVEISRSSSSLRYKFYKDGQALNFAEDHNYYIKETSRPDDSGSYLCEATTWNSEVKKLSNPVSVSVRRIPVSKPELTISPGTELIEGDTASIACSVSNGSTPINYIFYKQTNQEIYREASNLPKSIYQIGHIKKSTEGDYSCGVSNEAEELPQHSEPVAVSVIDCARSIIEYIQGRVGWIFMILREWIKGQGRKVELR
uniref:Fc receptor-like protein 2 n=1 Tax=Pristiophorus japonicus TaxID=55135 RepID=UPI00398E793D